MKAGTKQLIADDAIVAAKQQQAQQPMDERNKLMDELKQAQADGDWKAVANKAKQLADYQAKLETLELTAKQDKLIAVAAELKQAIQQAIDDTVGGLADQSVIELMDGIWFEQSFADFSSSIRLTAKPATSRKASTTGTGKRYEPSTTSLLEQHGSQLMGDSGLTFQQAWEAKTDKNSRYNVRKKLLKVAGITS